MSIRDGSRAAVRAARRRAGVPPDRRAVMLGGVTLGAAGAFAARGGQEGAAGARPESHAGISPGTAPPSPFKENDQSVTVLPYSFYGTSGDDLANINKAFTMLPTETISVTSSKGTKYTFTYTVGRVNLGPFTYVGATTIQKPVCVDLVGAGPGTVLRPSASATGFSTVSCHDSNGGSLPDGGHWPYGTYAVPAGTIRDLVIDGSAATGASAIGLNIGDGWGHKVVRARIQYFTGVGLYANNQYFYTEKGHFQCTLWENGAAAQLDVGTNGEASFEFNDFDFDVFVKAGQNGVSLTNGAYLSKGDLRMVGNFLTSGSSLSTAALTLTGTSPDGSFNSHISNSRIAIEIESDEGKTYSPYTVVFGSLTNPPGNTGANVLTGCTGTLVFDGSWAGSNVISSTPPQFTFGGVITDSNLTNVNKAPSGWL